MSKGPTSQRAHRYAEAAETMASNTVLGSLPESVWAYRAMEALQMFAVPLALWFKPVCVCIATFWLIYRAYQVLGKPLEELASVLGFDIPLTPTIDLANIRADGAIVHWSLPEKPKNKTKLKFEIHLNGNVVESVPLQETAVTITGLQPSSFYVVRVALMNEAEFGSRSEPIRFRTKAASSGDFFVNGGDGHETDHDGSSETLPHVRLYRGLKDITPAAIEAAPMIRELSSGGPGPKRSITGRRPSPAALGLETKQETSADDNEPPEGTESVQQLTEKLDAIRRDTDEAERQSKEEEEEEYHLKDDLIHERDTLRAEAAEKEKASRNLKREVNTLERQNTAAQNERSKHERMLQQKKQERKKLKDDVVRYEKEAQAMKADVERIQKEKSDYLQQIEQAKEALRNRHVEEASVTRNLDDEIREKNAEIKKLERSVKTHTPDGNEREPSMVQQFQHEAEEERNWHMHRANLQQQYAMNVQKLEDAKRFHHEQARYLESVRAQRRRDEEMSQQFGAPLPAQEQRLRRGDSQRSRKAPSGHSNSDSPRMGVFAISQSPFGNAMTSVAPFSSAPYLNIQNGMTITGPGDDRAMTEDEKERLTGGALMSPGAGADLLPADLFSGEGDNRNSPPERVVQPLPGLGSLPGLSTLPGPAPSPAHMLDGSGSPAESSRSPSVLGSPQVSQNNLYLGSPEHLMDPDRQSIRSNRSNRATSGGLAASSRFSSMFGIKPRPKPATADDGLALGKAQSHSMPRQDQGLPGLGSTTRKRNSSISHVFGANLVNNDGASDSVPDASASNSNASRKKAFGMGSIFGRDKEDGWPATFTNSFGRRPGSPRPGSTHSNELPRPSNDTGRWGVDTWPSTSNDTTAGARSSPLSFGPGWALPTSTSQPQSRLFGSRHPSRRPSVQYGVSGHPEDIMEDDDSDALDPKRSEPQLAPIGTKPSKKALERQQALAEAALQAESGAAPKLNPAAKDFKSYFGLKSKDKASKERGGSATPSAFFANSRSSDLVAPDDDSPPNSRKSRDARSMTTNESLSIAGESSTRTSNDLARTPSYSTSDAATGPSPLIGSLGKESFMQKITRKSSYSSGKFSLPTFSKKNNLSRLDPSSANGAGGGSGSGAQATTPTSSSFPEDDREDAMSGSMGSINTVSRESREKDGNRGSWRLKLAKVGSRKGETPSLSGLSVASGAEEGPDDGDD